MLALAAITLLACGGDTEPTTQAAPVNLSISPPVLSLVVGSEGLLAAQAFDANGRPTSALIEWSSADPSIASVRKTDGTVSAISLGTTTVIATTVTAAGRRSATAAVSVRPPDPAVTVSISPSSLILIAGGDERLTARGYDAAGQLTSEPFEWSSADPAVATVGKSDGIVTAITAGSTTVTAVVGAIRATATVSVTAIAGSFAFTRMTRSSAAGYTSDVLSYAAADRSIRSLPRNSQFGSIGAPAWSADGTKLAIEVIDGPFVELATEEYLDYHSNLYVLDATTPAGSPWRALTTNGLSKSPSWSPDGKRIAYLQQSALFSRNDIHIIDAAGGDPVRLTRTAGWYGTPRWSPDGTRLAFTDQGVGNGDIFLVKADGSGLTSVTRSSAADADPSWSPDGARLVFASADPAYASSDVWVIDANGSNLRLLTSDSFPHGHAGPVWSPDGRQIMFVLQAAPEDRPGIQLMNADGSSRFRLVTAPSGSWDQALAWRR